MLFLCKHFVCLLSKTRYIVGCERRIQRRKGKREMRRNEENPIRGRLLRRKQRSGGIQSSSGNRRSFGGKKPDES